MPRLHHNYPFEQHARRVPRFRQPISPTYESHYLGIARIIHRLLSVLLSTSLPQTHNPLSTKRREISPSSLRWRERSCWLSQEHFLLPLLSAPQQNQSHLRPGRESGQKHPRQLPLPRPCLRRRRQQREQRRRRQRRNLKRQNCWQIWVQ